MKFAHNFFQGRAITMDCQDYITESVERKKGQHLQREERGAIQHLKNAGYTNRAIARAIGCSPTTVGNELKRGTPPRKSSKGRKPGYSARRGEAVYNPGRCATGYSKGLHIWSTSTVGTMNFPGRSYAVSAATDARFTSQSASCTRIC